MADPHAIWSHWACYPVPMAGKTRRSGHLAGNKGVVVNGETSRQVRYISPKKIKGFEWDVSPCNEIISTVCWFSRTLVEGHPGNAAHQYWHRKTPKDRERPSKGYHTVHGGQVVNQSAVGIGMSIRSARPPLGRFTRGFPVPSRPAAARTRRAYPHGTTRQSLRNRRRSADRSGSSPAGKEFLIAGHRNPAGVDHMRGG